MTDLVLSDSNPMKEALKYHFGCPIVAPATRLGFVRKFLETNGMTHVLRAHQPSWRAMRRSLTITYLLWGIRQTIVIDMELL